MQSPIRGWPDALITAASSPTSRPIVSPAPAEFSSSSQQSGASTANAASSPAWMRGIVASRPLPRCEPTWKQTSAPICAAMPTVFVSASTDFW